jgi:Nuclease-related domain
MAHDVARQPGQWVRAQARERERRVWMLLGLVLAFALLVLAMSVNARHSVFAYVGLGLLILFRQAGKRQIEAVGNWLRGADSEEAVGEALTALTREGYTVRHDLEQRFEGNIDHLVSGPSGVFMIETKHRGYAEAHLRKARRQAKKLREELGVFVTPVICLDKRRGRDPYRDRGVWIVPRARLVGWVRSQSNDVLEPGRLAEFANQP